MLEVAFEVGLKESQQEVGDRPVWGSLNLGFKRLHVPEFHLKMDCGPLIPTVSEGVPTMRIRSRVSALASTPFARHNSQVGGALFLLCGAGGGEGQV